MDYYSLEEIEELGIGYLNGAVWFMNECYSMMPMRPFKE